jgi:phospholipid N-methyltransferase
VQLVEQLLFTRNFLRFPKMLGSAFPSSPFLVERVLRGIDWRTTNTFVEYGSGVGTFTREILRHLRRDARLIAIDTNEELAAHLAATEADARLSVVCGSAADVLSIVGEQDEQRADYVLSGIPFSTLEPSVRREVVSNTWQALRPGGEFLVYQFSGAVLPYLQETFGEVEEERELLNVLPARIFRCRRAS